jgi:predicted RNase H-like HicB family nuclease
MDKIVVEKTGTGFSAYVEDLPGCAAAAETRDETLRLLREAVVLHREVENAAQGRTAH